MFANVSLQFFRVSLRRATPATSTRSRAFGGSTDVEQIEQHYFRLQADVNPTGIVLQGPDPAVWQEPHDRARRG